MNEQPHTTETPIDGYLAVISRILGQYRITYSNEITQTKCLISHSDFENIIKPTETKIYELERANNWKPSVQSKKLKSDLKTMFSSAYFTDKSPLYEAISTGILILPKDQGGAQKCQVVAI